ncbi:hypothetical protein JKF63_01640 [Porcisia hertigi]|uniref:Uncharacterized protein n=1 Tax=Porcisia hertigi TaxID=2761500 RepID=A0A836LB08_9TRYP|nr:hypothetical protein JKF63_01640 [Porcisia hertigi]
MQPRVRLLYLEFMYLIPELKSFYSSQRDATAMKTQKDGDTGTASKPFYLRLPGAHPLCGPLRSAHVTELECRYHIKNPSGATSADTPVANAEASPSLVGVSTDIDAASRVKIFKLQREDEKALVAPFMPANWDNSNPMSLSPLSARQPVPSAERAAEAEYRARVQRLFYANALVPVGSPEWKRCLARGRYELRGIHNVLHVRKYRALHKRYSWASQLSRTELEAAWGGNMEEVEQSLLGLSNRDVYAYSVNDADGEGAKGNGEEKEHAERA